MRNTKLSIITKVSAEHETPPIANVLLVVGLMSIADSQLEVHSTGI